MGESCRHPTKDIQDSLEAGVVAKMTAGAGNAAGEKESPIRTVNDCVTGSFRTESFCKCGVPIKGHEDTWD